MPWRDFRFSIFLVAATLLCAAVAGMGIQRFRDSQPPDPRPLEFRAARNIVTGLRIGKAGRYLVDIEFDSRAASTSGLAPDLRSRLCDPPPDSGSTSGQCTIAAGRLDLLWKITDGEATLAEGNLRRTPATLEYGVFDWIALGDAVLPVTDRLAFSLWTGDDLKWLDEGNPRLRFWRAAAARGEGEKRRQEITTNAFFAAFFFGFLLILVAPLEAALHRKRRSAALRR